MSNGRAWNGLVPKDEKLQLKLKLLYVTGLADG
jgi:hypothetical protein